MKARLTAGVAALALLAAGTAAMGAGVPKQVTVYGWDYNSKTRVEGTNSTTRMGLHSNTYPKARKLPALSHNQVHSHPAEPRRDREQRKRLR